MFGESPPSEAEPTSSFRHSQCFPSLPCSQDLRVTSAPDSESEASARAIGMRGLLCEDRWWWWWQLLPGTTCSSDIASGSIQAAAQPEHQGSLPGPACQCVLGRHSRLCGLQGELSGLPGEFRSCPVLVNKLICLN